MIKPTLNQMLKNVADQFGLTTKEISGRSRHVELIPARFILCYMAYYEGRYSYTQIGFFLHRDHTTVMHAVERASELLENQTIKRKYLAALRAAKAVKVRQAG